MSVRVLVVDDSVVIRRLVTQALGADPTIEVVGVAANGRLALGKVEQLAPDLVTMDIEMPELDGISTVRALRAAGHRMPIIMFSTLTERGAAATLEALAAGATDYVAKPSGVGGLQEGLRRVAEELVPKVHALVPGRRRTERLASVPTTATAVATPPAATTRGPVRLRPATPRTTPVRAVVLGSSTGGPAALAELVAGLTEAPPVPVAIVQHMPAVFTRQLADRLDRIGPATVVEASDGETLLPGHVYVAPGGRHLLVAAERGGLRARLTDTPPVNYSRPSVDVLFRSAVAALGGELLAVVLTGMGADGAAGSGQVADAGGTVLVQDEATSVVWGMPGATAAAGHAHAVLPLKEIASAMRKAMGEARR
ncbi:chemotaxis-specific protein-glutamate methyltransferase CheB [Georgenia satyanarayanai]|uniref:chemotaxis-specific protein-glutamate methyltransferase CheB n=1 Tax=Georgenia satyanarayanai TaxID=860221 RepID=UPI00203A66A8|nr:chemotaxis-specific protein-glutamate methyltransferase CheB [Georgenia satyanarayanai]MCM3661936.1 chemotaxis-specific protein-glutamate methyltransferase CheB [Georgenia satyanarayanai]